VYKSRQKAGERAEPAGAAKHAGGVQSDVRGGKAREGAEKAGKNWEALSDSLDAWKRHWRKGNCGRRENRGVDAERRTRWGSKWRCRESGWGCGQAI
jgi:hypothetical protein